MIKILEETKGPILAITVQGKITKEDFDVFNPLLEKTIRDFENPGIYMEVLDLDIPTTEAIWNDLKNIPKYNRFYKIAFIGTKEWHKPMTKIFEKLTSPEVKYFDYDEKDRAMNWLKSKVAYKAMH